MDAPATTIPHRHVNTGLWLLGAFTAWMWIQSLWALDPSLHLEGCILFTKYTVLVFLLTRMIRSEGALELFGWAHVSGCFLWSVIAFTNNTGGRIELNLGPGVSDSNTLGVHLVTGLAFAGLMLVALPYRRRFLLLGMIPFILNAVILTASRGAALAMVAAGFSALMFAPRMRRWVLYSCAILGVALFFRLAGSELFWQRMGTLRVEQGQEMEASAASRIDIATAEWKMFQDYPFGAGYRGNVVLSPRYIPEQWLTDGERAAHNTFLAVLVDEGAIGLLLFSSMMLWALVKVLRLKRLDRYGLPIVLSTFRGAVAGGLVGYLVAGMFSNYMNAEVGVWMLAVVSVLDGLSTAWIPVPQPRRAVGVRSLQAAAASSR